MGFQEIKAAIRLKNGNKRTPGQQEIYELPPHAFIKEKPVPKAKEEPELDDEQQRRLLHSSTEYVRRVRELIREKYRLDVYVWDKRDTLECNRKLVAESCKRSDAILNEIYAIVAEWDRHLFTAEEWAIVMEIQAGVTRCMQEDRWRAALPWHRLPSGGVRA